LIVLTIFYLLFNHKEIKYFLPRAVLIIFLFLVSNFYWIYGLLLNRTPSPYETVNTTDANAALANMKISLEYYQTFNNFNFIFLNGVNPNSSFDIIYYLSLSFFALIITFSISYYSYFVINNIFKKQKVDYFGLSIFSSLILIGYLQSISLSKFGIDVFLYLSKYIFVLNGLRNYINKVPMTYSLVILVTILIVYIFLNKKYKSIAVAFLIVTILFSIVSLRNLIKLEDYKFNLSEGYTRTTSFDSETIELVKYLNSDQPFQRTAYFPLSIGPWSIIKNHETKELYIGHSPLLGLAGMDDLNGMFNIEGLGLLNKRFPNENFLEMEPEKIIFRLKFLGVNKLVVNNTIDLRNSNLMGYPRTNKYPEILEFVKNNLRLDFETKNKSYSVYDVNKDQIQFKKYMYKPSESEKLNFYSVNFEEASFTFSDISDNFFNYFPSKPTLEEENLDIFWDNFGNKIKMKYIEPEKTSIQQTKGEMFYSLKVEGNNVLRIKIDHPKDVFNVDVAVDDKNIPCSNKVFNKNSKCNIFKNIKPQIINDSLIYTLESGPNSPNYIYVSIVNKKTKELNIKDINTKFIIGDTNLIKYNPFSIEERQRYLDKYFVKNPSGPSYQIPKKVEVVRKDKDTYEVDIKLDDKNLPLILTLKNAYNTKWDLEGKGIKKQTNFNSDVVFNGWIVEPNGDTDTLELTIKYKDSKIREYIQPINYLAINLCLLIVLTYIVYGTYKILIRKFWR
jgi:hypothetical protein